MVVLAAIVWDTIGSARKCSQMDRFGTVCVGGSGTGQNPEIGSPGSHYVGDHRSGPEVLRNLPFWHVYLETI